MIGIRLLYCLSGKKHFTRAEAARYCGVSVDMLNVWERQGRIRRVIRIDDVIVYKKDEIMRLATERSVDGSAGEESGHEK